MESLRTLLASNECLTILGASQQRQDWVSIGEAYVNGVVQSELKDWETCASRYSSAASELWVLEEEREGRVVGCVGAVANVGPGGSDCSMELVRMYVDQGNSHAQDLLLSILSSSHPPCLLTCFDPVLCIWLSTLWQSSSGVDWAGSWSTCS